MTQAEVDLKLNGDSPSVEFTRPLPLSYKRKTEDDDCDENSSQEEDNPSWHPCIKQLKKRRRCHRPRDHHAHAALTPYQFAHHRDNHANQSSTTDPNHYYLRPEISDVRVELTDECDNAWEDFRPLGTEMIICKEGRRMFPSVEVMLEGLQPSHIYSILISVELTDQHRYRYNEEQGWITITSGAPPSIPARMVPHSDSRNTGSHFMKKPLSFKTTKMTNNFNTDRNNQLILLSMRKYIPVITVRCHTTGQETIHRLYTCDFIAVTSYQRVEVTQLKIFTNQFAAAFRKRSTTPPEIVKKIQQIKSDAQLQKTKKSSKITHSTRTTSQSSLSTSTVNSKTDSEVDAAVSKNSVQCGSKDRVEEASPLEAVAYEEIDYDSTEESIPSPHCYFTDEPPHIRPFIFQPRYHYGLDPAFHPAVVHRNQSHPPPPPPPPPPPLRRPRYQPVARGSELEREMLWSSMGYYSNSDGTEDESDCLSLGLLGETL